MQFLTAFNWNPITPEDVEDEPEIPELEFAAAEAVPIGGAPCLPLFEWIPITPEDDEDELEIPELGLAALSVH